MMKISVGSTSGQIDHTILAELLSRRWKEARSYYTFNRTLEASCRRQPGRSVLELHWSRCGPPAIASADLFPALQAVFDGAA